MIHSTGYYMLENLSRDITMMECEAEIKIEYATVTFTFPLSFCFL